MSRSPYLLLGIGLILPFLWSACGNGTASATSRPIPGTEVYHDFGVLDLGESKTHDFLIPLPPRSKGYSLIPQAYVGNCSCASGMLMIKKPDGRSTPIWGRPDEDRQLAEDDQLILRLTLKTKDKEAKDLPHSQELGSVTFKHTDGRFQRFTKQRVRFHFGIRSPIKATPVAHIDFGELPMSNPAFVRTIELRSNIPGQKLSLDEPRTMPECVGAELSPTDDGYRLVVTITPYKDQRTAPKIRGGVSIATGLKHYPHLWIPVTGSFIGDIQYEPSIHISFNIFPFDQIRKNFVIVTDHDRRRPVGFVVHSFLDLNGNDVSQHFEVTFQRLSGRQLRVKVKYLGTMGGINMRAWLSLSKRAGDDPIAKIRLTGFNAQH